MNLQFVGALPLEAEQQPILLSPPAALEFMGIEYLLIEKDGDPIKAFEIRYDYQAGAAGIYPVTQNVELLWQNSNLGIDGVINIRVTDSKIYESGEWNPPGERENSL